MTTERERFEAWAKRSGWPHYCFDGEQFTHAETQQYSPQSWAAWQAAYEEGYSEGLHDGWDECH